MNAHRPCVVVAPDKFKGSLAATDVAAALARGLSRSRPDALAVQHPVADGGEGTVEMALAHGYEPVTVTVTGPLGDPLEATFAMSAEVAVIEMASAAGLPVLGSAPDATTAALASTQGVGEAMTAALDRGAERIVLGVGGSATTDGGAGAVTALGARLHDAAGNPVAPGGAALASAVRLDLGGLDGRLREVEVIVACDVDNPLTGTSGAAAVYGPQKGATPELVAELDAALGRWADLVARVTGDDRRDMQGAGAAGGLAFGLAALLGARLTSGIELLLELTGFEDRLRGADFVVVGEGSLDQQSLRGKGPLGVARMARRHGVPVVAVVGRSLVTAEEARAAGLSAVYPLTELEPNERRSMTQASRLLEQVAGTVASQHLPGTAREHRDDRNPSADGRGGLDKVVGSAAEAVADIGSGSTLEVGGFGLCGIPSVLIEALLEQGADDLEAVSNNCGVDEWGLGRLLFAKRIRRMVSSYVGENKEFARQYLHGELEVELTPQGTLAERMRAGGCGVPAFFTATGVGTQVAEGGLPWKYDSDGNVVVSSPAKEVRTFETAEGPKEFVLENAIVADFGLVRAWKGDRHGNLVFRDSARNFNPLAAMCGRVTIAEVEQLVEPGELDPNAVHTPGVFVQRVVPLTPEQAADKRIEKRTVRPRPGADVETEGGEV